MRPGTKKRRPSLGERKIVRRKIVRCALSRNTAPKYVHVYQKSGLSAKETTVIEKALKMLWQVWQKSNKWTVEGQLICNACVVFDHISFLSPPYPRYCVNSSYKKERICLYVINMDCTVHYWGAQHPNMYACPASRHQNTYFPEKFYLSVEGKCCSIVEQNLYHLP